MVKNLILWLQANRVCRRIKGDWLSKGSWRAGMAKFSTFDDVVAGIFNSNLPKANFALFFRCCIGMI